MKKVYKYIIKRNEVILKEFYSKDSLIKFINTENALNISIETVETTDKDICRNVLSYLKDLPEDLEQIFIDSDLPLAKELLDLSLTIKSLKREYRKY